MLRLVLPTALIAATVIATPAWAGFAGDVQNTFQHTIPHFFQDDIPCAFGGQPTSHTRTRCKNDHRHRLSRSAH